MLRSLPSRSFMSLLVALGAVSAIAACKGDKGGGTSQTTGIESAKVASAVSVAPPASPSAGASAARGIAPIASATAATATSKCEPAGKLETWRYRAALAVTYTGEVLLTGGSQHDSGSELRDVDSFNVTKRTWTKAPPMLHARAGHIAIADQSFHKIYVAGGSETSVEAFDAPAEGRRWVSVGATGSALFGTQAFRTAEGIAIAGGDLLYKGALSAEALILEPKVGRLAAMPKARAGAVVVTDSTKGTTTFIGGLEADAKTPEKDLVFTDKTRTWSETNDSTLDYVRKMPHLEKVIYLDAAKRLAVTNTGVLVYSTTAKAWEPRATFAQNHDGGAAIALDGGKVLVVGGLDEKKAEAELCTIPDP